MIAYAMLGSDDVAWSRRFWDPLAALLGATVVEAYSGPNRVWYGRDGAPPFLVITTPWDGGPARAGNGAMLALPVDSPETVAKVHARALELGGKDEGGPGVRSGNWHGAYFRDLDGNKIAVFALV